MRLRLLAVALLLIGFACLSQQSGAYWQTRDSGYNVSTGAAPPAYTGPGDIKPYVAWWGMQCYNAAYAGNVASVWDSATGNTTQTLVTCSAGGTLNQTVNSLATTCATACELETYYDQPGQSSGACAGSTHCNLTNAHGSRPQFILNSLNTIGCPVFAASASPVGVVTSATTLTLPQPFSSSLVAKRTGNTGNITGAIVQPANDLRIGYAFSVDTTMLYTGGSITNGPTATDNAFHAIGYVANNASSLIGVDATSASTVNIGSTTGFTSTPQMGHGSAGGFVGTICGGGIANATWNATDIQNVNANYHALFGVW